MREIILVRHALVDVDKTEKIAAKDLKPWVEQYDIAPLHPKSQPSEDLHKIVNAADFLLTSKLTRAINSADFFEKEIDESNATFNELLIPNIKIPYFKFKAKTWLIILKLILFLSTNQTTKIEEAINYLLELSTQHQKVVLVGHGGLNYYLHKALLKKGWSLHQKPSHQNWGVIHLVKT